MSLSVSDDALDLDPRSAQTRGLRKLWAIGFIFRRLLRLRFPPRACIAAMLLQRWLLARMQGNGPSWRLFHRRGAGYHAFAVGGNEVTGSRLAGRWCWNMAVVLVLWSARTAEYSESARNASG